MQETCLSSALHTMTHRGLGFHSQWIMDFNLSKCFMPFLCRKCDGHTPEVVKGPLLFWIQYSKNHSKTHSEHMRKGQTQSPGGKHIALNPFTKSISVSSVVNAWIFQFLHNALTPKPAFSACGFASYVFFLGCLPHLNPCQWFCCITVTLGRPFAVGEAHRVGEGAQVRAAQQ